MVQNGAYNAITRLLQSEGAIDVLPVLGAATFSNQSKTCPKSSFSIVTGVDYVDSSIVCGRASRMIDGAEELQIMKNNKNISVRACSCTVARCGMAHSNDV